MIDPESVSFDWFWRDLCRGVIRLLDSPYRVTISLAGCTADFHSDDRVAVVVERVRRRARLSGRYRVVACGVCGRWRLKRRGGRRA